MQKDWCVSYGFHVPSRKSVAAQTTQLSSGPAKDAVDLSQQYGHSFPATWNKAMTTAFIQSATKIGKGNGDAATELANAAKTCQAELDKQNT